MFRLNKPTRQSLTAIALAALSFGAGCGRTARDTERFDTRQFVADVAAFQDRPSEQTWEPLRIALLTTPPKVAVESTLVEVLAGAPVSERVLDAAAVDLATADWPGAMKWVRQYNVAARTPRASARETRRRGATARLAWLLLALRPGYAKDPVDLTHADLRDTAPFVGQAMNLTNVDFSGAVLSGGTWRSANVRRAQFSAVSIGGTLRCANCTFGNVRYPGVLMLAGGQWAAP